MLNKHWPVGFAFFAVIVSIILAAFAYHSTDAGYAILTSVITFMFLFPLAGALIGAVVRVETAFMEEMAHTACRVWLRCPVHGSGRSDPQSRSVRRRILSDSGSASRSLLSGRRDCRVRDRVGGESSEK